MIGLFSNRTAGVGPLEYNSILDPYAAAMLYQARTKVHRSIGLEITVQVQLSQEEVRQRFTAPLLQPVLAFAEIWFRRFPYGITFHDPLAAAAVFNPAVCTFERGLVDVELESPRLLGFTRWTPDPANGPHEVAVTVNREAFFVVYFSVFS